MNRQYVVVGAGGTASHLIHALVCYAAAFPGGGIIHIWDADEIEPKNLERQLFYANEVGKLKATAFAQRWPEICVDHTEYVGEDNVTRVIQNDDVVLICADNMAVRRLINNHAKTLGNIVIINGGNEKHSGSVQYFERILSVNITPPLNFASSEFDPANDEFDRSEMSCAEIAVLTGGEQTIIANQTTAALMMAALWRSDNDVHDTNIKNWTKITFDHLEGLVQTSDVRMLKGALDD